MAYSYAYAEFDSGALDLNWYGANLVAMQFLDNAGANIEGSVFEDVVSVEARDAFEHLTLYFGGTGFAFNRSGEVTGGTVTAIYLYDAAGAQFAWGVTGISLPATSVYTAFATASTADDIALLQQALAGADTIELSEFADTAFGYGGNDTILGYGGNDTISGGDGDDTLRGHAGDDLLIGDAGDDWIFGGGGNDQLFGGDGDDVLEGGRGDDAMSGGAGSDRYYVNSAGDIVTEAVDEGIDEVRASNISFVLPDHVENLRIKTGDFDGTGNALDNTIFGSGGANTISGLGGNDTLRGAGGRDVLFGGDGDDYLAGGAGSLDEMTGGTGADRFAFAAIDESTTGPVNADVIRDFNQAEGDLISLFHIDAIAGGADDPFTFIGTAAFSGTAGELRYRFESGTGDTMVELDVDGDGVRDMSIRLTGHHDLVAGDFVL